MVDQSIMYVCLFLWRIGQPCLYFHGRPVHWGIADAEIKVLSSENTGCNSFAAAVAHSLLFTGGISSIAVVHWWQLLHCCCSLVVIPSLLLFTCCHSFTDVVHWWSFLHYCCSLVVIPSLLLFTGGHSFTFCSLVATPSLITLLWITGNTAV